ncbi:hypothetical protein [Bacillus kwashiorkori]|uniref:hypothetical protein n=1 Tax=Bacillus kwashiorkori TaxID=1522318 RepID=UPI00078582E2|nr:hypothetical protein [Bacillus kwashiorkori]
MGYLLPVNLNQYKTYQMRMLQKKDAYQRVAPVLKVAKPELQRKLHSHHSTLNYQNKRHSSETKGFYIDRYI